MPKRPSSRQDLRKSTKKQKPKADVVTEESTKHSSINTKHLSINGESQKKNTSVLVLGEGDAGQLGLGPDILSASYPKSLDLSNILTHNEQITMVCAGGMHSIIITNKKAISFGCNDEGALGQIGEESLPKEISINNLLQITDIVCGDSHTIVLDSSGTVYGWGTFRDENGILGLVKGEIQHSPAILYHYPKEPVIRIASGSKHLLMLTLSGRVLSIGSAEQGQLGRISSRFASKEQRNGLERLLKPTTVSLPLIKGQMVKIKDIYATSYSSFAISKSDQVYGWGLNNYNQLGISLDITSLIIYNPISIDLKIRNIKQICGGSHYTIILDSDGKVYSMGRKDYGRLGLGIVNEDVIEPRPIPDFQEMPCKLITASESVSHAVTRKGEIFSWGMGETQLGLGQEEDCLTPQRMKGKLLNDRSVVSVSAGGQHSLILVLD